ncbi:MAG: hypothetical protein ACHQVS_04395 [Candidatus Babeliales bacterium]
MNLKVLLSLALAISIPAFASESAEEREYKREKETKEKHRRESEEEVLREAAASSESATTQIAPKPYPKAQDALEKLKAKIELLGNAAITAQERLKLSADDLASEIRKRGFKQLSEDEQLLYDTLMFGGLAEVYGEAQGVQGMVCEYLTGWHEVGQFKGHQANGVVNALAIYHDKNNGYREKLVSGGQDGAIKIWDVLTQTCEYTLDYASPVTALNILSFGPKKPDMIAAAYGTQIRLFTLQKGKAPELTNTIYTHNLSPIIYLEHHIDADKNVRLHSFGAQDNNMKEWNIDTGALTNVPVFVAPLLPHGADKPGLFSANYAARTTQCLALPTHTPTAFSDTVGLHYNEIRQESGNELFASGDTNGTIYIWDIKNPGCVATLRGHTAKITALKLIINRFYISKLNAQCKCTCPECETAIKTFKKGNYYEAHCKACKEAIEKMEKEYPETLQLISASEDGTTRLWEMSEGTRKLPAVITQEKESDSDSEGCGCSEEYTNPECACECHNEDSDTEEEEKEKLNRDEPAG